MPPAVQFLAFFTPDHPFREVPPVRFGAVIDSEGPGPLVEGRNSCFCSPRGGRLWWRIGHRFSEGGRKPSLPANIEMLSTENYKEGCYSREESQTLTACCSQPVRRASLSWTGAPAR